MCYCHAIGSGLRQAQQDPQGHTSGEEGEAEAEEGVGRAEGRLC